MGFFLVGLGAGLYHQHLGNGTPESPREPAAAMAGSTAERMSADTAPTVAAPPQPAAGTSTPAASPAPAVAAATGPAMASVSTSPEADEPAAAPPAAVAAAPEVPKPAAAPKPVAAPKPPAAAAKPPAAAKPAAAIHVASAKPPARHHDAAKQSFRVQFGAFAAEENAQRLGKALSTPKARISVTRGEDAKGRMLWYVRSASYGDMRAAVAAAHAAQNAAKQAHFVQPVTYVIVREAAGSAPTVVAATQIAQRGR